MDVVFVAVGLLMVLGFVLVLFFKEVPLRTQSGMAAAQSAREGEVLQLVADGQSNKEIGEALSLSALTVKSHLSRIGRKLGTGDRAQMVALAMRAGVIR